MMDQDLLSWIRTGKMKNYTFCRISDFKDFFFSIWNFSCFCSDILKPHLYRAGNKESIWFFRMYPKECIHSFDMYSSKHLDIIWERSLSSCSMRFYQYHELNKETTTSRMSNIPKVILPHSPNINIKAYIWEAMHFSLLSSFYSIFSWLVWSGTGLCNLLVSWQLLGRSCFPEKGKRWTRF
jgi:hypothetical protein